MIGYRDVVREVATAAELRRLLALIDRGETEELLIGAGELEQGISDARHAAINVWDDVQARLRETVCAAASVHLQARAGRPHGRALAWTRSLLERLDCADLPRNVAIKPPEGYMHYALDPVDYANSANRYMEAVGRERARHACVIGIRSIGTSLSAVVAAAIGEVRSVTLRPHGSPGQRRVCADPSLCARVIAAHEHADVLIVDEGPGATGETFACVAAWVESLGIEAGRIVLLSHHASGLGLAPDERRGWFARVRRHVPPHTNDAVLEAANALDLEPLDDLSGGRWRAAIPGSAALPSCPHHERRKQRARRSDGSLALLRYGGRGRWGQATLARALELARLGLGPEVLGAAAGFIALRWIEGRPVQASEVAGAGFRAAVCAYLIARAGRFATGEAVDVERLIEVTLENTRELLGPNPPGLAGAIERLEQLPEQPAVIADARMAAHEWVRTFDGYVKTDALDHGDGIRPPGPVDAAWDLAAAAVEYALDNATIAALCERCATACERSPAALESAVAAHRVPYLACGLGELTLSVREVFAADDRARLQHAAARQLGALRRELARITEGAPC